MVMITKKKKYKNEPQNTKNIAKLYKRCFLYYIYRKRIEHSFKKQKLDNAILDLI